VNASDALLVGAVPVQFVEVPHAFEVAPVQVWALAALVRQPQTTAAAKSLKHDLGMSGSSRCKSKA
jgi:hypothetical protein